MRQSLYRTFVRASVPPTLPLLGPNSRTLQIVLHLLTGPGDDSLGLSTSLINGCTAVCFGCSQDMLLWTPVQYSLQTVNFVPHLMDIHPPNLLIIVIIYTVSSKIVIVVTRCKLVSSVLYNWVTLSFIIQNPLFIIL